MRRLSVSVLLVVVVVNVGAARGSVVVWNVSDGGNGHAYSLVGNYLDPLQRWSWEESKVMAEGMKYNELRGHLVTIASEAESQFLITTFHNANPWPTWIGLTGSEAFGGSESSTKVNPRVDGWKWVTGEAITFTNWYPGAPNEYRSGEDFVVMGN